MVFHPLVSQNILGSIKEDLRLAFLKDGVRLWLLSVKLKTPSEVYFPKLLEDLEAYTTMGHEDWKKRHNPHILDWVEKLNACASSRSSADKHDGITTRDRESTIVEASSATASTTLAHKTSGKSIDKVQALKRLPSKAIVLFMLSK